MSRLHRSHPRDWSLEVTRDEYTGFSALSRWPPGAPRYQLSMTLTRREMDQLLRVIEERHDAYRGYPSFSIMTTGYVQASGIEVTEDEVRRMASGDDPFEVLLGEFPPCGYRLHAVPDPVLGG